MGLQNIIMGYSINDYFYGFKGESMKAFLFVTVSTLLFIFVSWLIYTLARGDISNIFNWAKYLYFIVFPISCFMLVYESTKTGKWLETKSLTTITFLINLFYIIMLFLFRALFNKIRHRKPRGTMKYGIVYNDKNIEFANNYAQQRIMMFFVVIIVINPIFNVYCVIQFIKAFFPFP